MHPLSTSKTESTHNPPNKTVIFSSSSEKMRDAIFGALRVNYPFVALSKDKLGKFYRVSAIGEVNKGNLAAFVDGYLSAIIGR